MRRVTVLAILLTLVLAAIPFTSVSGRSVQSLAGQSATGTAATGTAGTTTTGTATPAATVVSVTPGTVNGGDAITVVADNLPISSTGILSPDQVCAYLVDASGDIIPLARVPTPNITGVPPDPSLTPGGAPNTGVGSFIVPAALPDGVTLLAPGTYTVQVAACSAGTAPVSITAIGTSAPITYGTSSTTAPAVAVLGFDIANPLTIGTSFSADLTNISGAACAFLAPDDVFDGVTITPGVAIPAGSSSVSLTIPATYPSGRYQIFITSQASGGTCPTSQLTGVNVLASTPVTAEAAKVASVSLSSTTTFPVAATATVSATVTLRSATAVGSVCLVVWVAGAQYTAIPPVTVPSGAFVSDTATVPFTIPANVSGTATISASLGACPTTGAPTTFDAYTTVVVATSLALTPTATATTAPTGTPPTAVPTTAATTAPVTGTPGTLTPPAPPATLVPSPTPTPCPGTTTMAAEAATPVTPVATSIPAPTATPCPATAVPTATSTAVPTATTAPSPTSAPSPTAKPTKKPTATPTKKPVVPTPTPTKKPTPKPTPTPTKMPKIVLPRTGGGNG